MRSLIFKSLICPILFAITLPVFAAEISENDPNTFAHCELVVITFGYGGEGRGRFSVPYTSDSYRSKVSFEAPQYNLNAHVHLNLAKRRIKAEIWSSESGWYKLAESNWVDMDFGYSPNNTFTVVSGSTPKFSAQIECRR